MDSPVISEAARAAEQDYLRRLELAGQAAGIGRPGRADLHALIRERFTMCRAEAPYTADPLSLVLDTINQLGTPELLATRTRAAWPDAVEPQVLDISRRERTALIGLSLGWLTAGIGVIVGLIALAGCSRWTRFERAAAALAALSLIPLAAVNLTPLIYSEPWPTLSLMLAIAGFVGLPWAMHGALRRRHGTAL